MIFDDDYCGYDCYECPNCDEKAQMLMFCQREVEDLMSEVFSFRAFDEIRFESALENLCARLSITYPNKEVRIGRK